MNLLRVWQFHADITAGVRKMSDQEGPQVHSSILLNLGRWPFKNSSWPATSVHMPLISWLDMAGLEHGIWNQSLRLLLQMQTCADISKIDLRSDVVLICPRKYALMSKQFAFAFRFPQ